MVFSSVLFLFYFLPLFILLYFCLPWRNETLLAASLLFYAWGEPGYVVLLLVYIAVNYAFGRLIEAADGRRRAWLLGLGVGLNLAGLVVFKYAGFLLSQIDWTAARLGLPVLPVPQLALPLGISFFTFQGISYLVDVHRGEIKASRSLIAFAMYKAMFSQLIAGPIVRYKSIAGKVDHRPVSGFRLRIGFERFILGLAQKVLIANTVALPADRIFGLPTGELTAATAWLGAVCYMLQIYFDFAGYSNMAIGLGHLMGFTFPENFRRPYAARSVTEFWRRWHISLSTWFRDYLYIPLGGNRRGAWRTYANLLIVFALCGFWHGASWTFLAWGLYHGLFLAAERALGGLPWRAPAPLRHAYLLLAVLVGWVLFRCDSLGHAGAYLTAMAGFGGGDPVATPLGRELTNAVATALLAGAVFAVLPPPDERRLARALRARLARFGQGWAAGVAARGTRLAFGGSVLLLLVASAFSIASGTYNPFIYFRF